MKATDLKTVGEALHGPQWRSALARDINSHEKQIRRYEAGTPIPDTMREKLFNVLSARIVKLERLLPRLRP